jgi:hypothetical protein
MMVNENWNLNDPYVFQTLTTIVGNVIAVQTTRGSVRGVLKTVMPDHIVVEMGGTPFYILTKQIIWVNPI